MAYAFQFTLPVTHNKLALISILITITMEHHHTSCTHVTMLRHIVGTINTKNHSMINSDFNQFFFISMLKSGVFFSVTMIINCQLKTMNKNTVTSQPVIFVSIFSFCCLMFCVCVLFSMASLTSFVGS